MRKIIWFLVGFNLAVIGFSTVDKAYGIDKASVNRWKSTALSVGWKESQWPKLRCIIWRESGGKPGAHNGRDPHRGSLGLMQINGINVQYLRQKGVLREFRDLRNPRVNLRAARVLFEARGWKPWYSRRKPC